MNLTRRETLAAGGAALLATVLPMPSFASVEDLVAEFTGGAEMKSEGLELIAPEIAENGNTVPIEVSAPGATSIMVLATGNPTPPVATFNFGPLAADQAASTRIRLAKTQEVVAIAKLGDGSFARAAQTVKVTIGGCGG
ncbi:sulfur-oxidizing protein SoxY [Poseidonocella pacifica]|uniref:Sulfur-oxidizing protein SoxY n=1 Tax=Poseidonocella pacifica TaxID=871651 RepID=A0A1I0VG70_9RHOB|nr:thiosulfate oxidation carrier protein SoxY [Poseidonocella pacifica]SFA75023.1 sulfur-oxidizing protein SoxY [Poseidonocella pacifica]